jgi:phage tail-like protein
MSNDDGSQQSKTIWPIPVFHFQVKWDKKEMSFQDVGGLEVSTDAIEYRSGDSKEFSVIKMPGIQKFGAVTMSKGVYKGDNNFWDWFNEIKMNTVKRKTIIISLLDELHKPTMVWTLKNAWPSKITGADLKSTSNEVAIEKIEIQHEGITIENK